MKNLKSHFRPLVSHLEPLKEKGLEKKLIEKYFQKDETCAYFVTNKDLVQFLEESENVKIVIRHFGRYMVQLGFVANVLRINGVKSRGYYVIQK
jgi:translation initiation factor IF-3